MSAMEIDWTPLAPSQSHLHVVTEVDMIPASRRRADAKRVVRTQVWATAKAYAGLGAVIAVFGGAAVTIVWSFLAVPNVALP